MIRTKNRLRLCCSLLVLNLIFIWGNSLLPGEISGAISDAVKEAVKAVLQWLLPAGQEETPGGGLLRKLAHFTEFACLGMLLYWLTGMLRHKTWERFLWPLAAGVAVAATDETIQCFVPLRGPALKDVGIDTLGVLTGILIISVIHQIKRKRHM